jgi:hypothetical protein
LSMSSLANRTADESSFWIQKFDLVTPSPKELVPNLDQVLAQM